MVTAIIHRLHKLSDIFRTVLLLKCTLACGVRACKANQMRKSPGQYVGDGSSVTFAQNVTYSPAQPKFWSDLYSDR